MTARHTVIQFWDFCCKTATFTNTTHNAAVLPVLIDNYDTLGALDME